MLSNFKIPLSKTRFKAEIRTDRACLWILIKLSESKSSEMCSQLDTVRVEVLWLLFSWFFTSNSIIVLCCHLDEHAGTCRY